MFGEATRIDGMQLRLQDRVLQQESREYVQGFATSARDHRKACEVMYVVAHGNRRQIRIAERAGEGGQQGLAQDRGAGPYLNAISTLLRLLSGAICIRAVRFFGPEFLRLVKIKSFICTIQPSEKAFTED